MTEAQPPFRLIGAAYRMMSRSVISVLLAACLIGLVPEASSGQSTSSPSLETINQISRLITDYANNICQNIPIKGSGDSITLSAEASAQLGGVLRKIAGLSGSAGTTISSDSYQGLLQQDLANAIASGDNCRQNAAQEFITLLQQAVPNLVPPPPPPPDLVQSAENFIVTLKECHNVQTDVVQCSFFINNEGPDRNLTLGGGGTEILDSNGITQPEVSAEIASVTGMSPTTLVGNGVPVTAQLSFGGNNAPITGLPRLYLRISAANYWSSLVWKNVPLSSGGPS